MNEPTTVGPGDDRRESETSLREEVENLGRIVDHQERTIATLSREVDLHSKALGWRLQQRLIPLRRSLLAVPVVRQIYRALYRVLEIWVDEGFLQIFSRAGHKASLALRGRNFLVEGADRRAPRVEDQYEQWMLLHGDAPEPGRDARRDRTLSRAAAGQPACVRGRRRARSPWRIARDASGSIV